MISLSRSNRPPLSLRVLVADDDVFSQQLTIALLKRNGHGGVVVDNGQRAFDAVTSQRFDLVLLDIHMPVLDGLATLAKLRRYEGGRGAPNCLKVIMVTAHAEPLDLIRLHEAGADGVITKALDPTCFAREIARVLQVG